MPHVEVKESLANNALVDLVALDLAGSELVVAATVAVAKAVTVVVDVELNSARVWVERGGRVELDSVDVQDGSECDVLAAAVASAMHGGVAAISGVDINLPSGGKGGEKSNSDDGSLHLDYLV
jgi:hypothetical protein